MPARIMTTEEIDARYGEALRRIACEWTPWHESSHACVALALGLDVGALLVARDGEGYTLIAHGESRFELWAAAVASAAGVVMDLERFDGLDPRDFAYTHANDIERVKLLAAKFTALSGKAMPDPYRTARGLIRTPAVGNAIVRLARAIVADRGMGSEDIARVVGDLSPPVAGGEVDSAPVLLTD